jgi:hypothetical protein
MADAAPPSKKDSKDTLKTAGIIFILIMWAALLGIAIYMFSRQ